MFEPDSILEKAKAIIDGKKLRRMQLSPKALLRGVYKESVAAARKLGGERKNDVPDRYFIQINYQDWEEYFGHRQREIESYLSTELHAKLSSRQCASACKPIIELAKDFSLRQGEFRITSSFSDRPSAVQAEEANPLDDFGSLDAGIKAPGKAKASTPKETPSFAEVIAFAETEPMRNDKTVAYLETKAGTRFTVHAGDSIGVLRNPEEKRPDIVLDADAYRFVSQIHGTFSYSDGWRYRDSSKNGTEVRTDGARTRLRKGCWAKLENGCEIAFGHGAALSFRTK